MKRNQKYVSLRKDKLYFMQEDIHPDYNQTKVTCDCGNEFKVGSTKDKIEVEICHECHPFYTGEERVLDTTGRVEKFEQRVEKAKTKQEEQKDTEEQSEQKEEEKADEEDEEE